MSTEPSSNVTYLLWLEFSGGLHNWWCLIVPEENSDTFKRDAWTDAKGSYNRRWEKPECLE